jgi:hypothetical protein
MLETEEPGSQFEELEQQSSVHMFQSQENHPPMTQDTVMLFGACGMQDASQYTLVIPECLTQTQHE